MEIEAKERRYTNGFEAWRIKYATAKSSLVKAEAAHKMALAKKAEELLPAATEAALDMKIASEIRSIVHRSPTIVRRGFFDLYVMARMMHEVQFRHRLNEATSEKPMPDFNNITDIWGVGKLPKP